MKLFKIHPVPNHAEGYVNIDFIINLTVMIDRGNRAIGTIVTTTSGTFYDGREINSLARLISARDEGKFNDIG